MTITRADINLDQVYPTPYPEGVLRTRHTHHVLYRKSCQLIPISEQYALAVHFEPFGKRDDGDANSYIDEIHGELLHRETKSIEGVINAEIFPLKSLLKIFSRKAIGYHLDGYSLERIELYNYLEETGLLSQISLVGTGKLCQLHALLINPAHQGKGLGLRMIEEFLGFAKKPPVRAVCAMMLVSPLGPDGCRANQAYMTDRLKTNTEGLDYKNVLEISRLKLIDYYNKLKFNQEMGHDDPFLYKWL